MYEVGKRVICVKNHSQRIVVTGQVFEIEGIRKSRCKCGGIELNIGIGAAGSACGHCVLCKANYITNDGIYWLDALLFAPYDDSLSETTVDELLNEFICV